MSACTTPDHFHPYAAQLIIIIHFHVCLAVFLFEKNQMRMYATVVLADVDPFQVATTKNNLQRPKAAANFSRRKK